MCRAQKLGVTHGGTAARPRSGGGGGAGTTSEAGGATSARWQLNPSSASRSVALSSGAMTCGANLGARSLAPSRLPHKRHIASRGGWLHRARPTDYGIKMSRRHGFWRQDVLPRHHELWRRGPRSRNAKRLYKGLNVRTFHKNN